MQIKIEKDFYDLVERPKFLKHILYGDTDSIFIQIPKCPDDIYEKIRVVNETSREVNELIEGYTTSYLLPRCGFSPDRNETHFKDEMLITAMVFLDIKKAYAYRQVAAEAEVDENNKLIRGKIFTKPKITKKSGLGVKSDTIDMTKKIMEKLIDISLLLGVSPADKYSQMLEMIGKFNAEFHEKINAFDAKNIGTPVRWQKKAYVNNAMKLYNTVVEPTFQFLSPGYFLYCKFNSMQLIKNTGVDLPFEKLNAIVIPHKFDRDKIKNAFQKFQIELDIERQWESILNKTCYRIIENVKKRK